MDRELISVQLLGGFNLRCSGSSIGSLARKPASLLAYLIMYRDRPQTRDLLAGRFWSDLPEDRARKRLSNALWHIRSALQELGLDDLLVTSTASIQVSDEWPIELDVDELEQRLDDIERHIAQRTGRGSVVEKLAELIEDYPGDLLAGHYADWIEHERLRIQDRIADAFWHIIRLYKARSDYRAALRYARQLVAHAPTAEDSHREVMRLCALLGQTSAAERQFESCQRILEVELGVEPSWETSDLLDRIRADAASAAMPLGTMEAIEAPMVGRIRERAILLSRIDDLMVGSGGLILIEGEPGIGKSRLVEDLVDSADWRGARVLSASHTDLSRMQPYQGIHDALAPATMGLRGEHLAEIIDQIWLQYASEVLPELRRIVSGSPAHRALRPEEEPARMSEALSRVLLAQGGLGPSLIVLEDVHWADDDSMQVFTNLGNRLSRSGVLICLTYRRFEAEQTQEVWSAISRLESMPDASRIVLGPLNTTELRELVTEQIGPGVLPARVLEQLVEESDGNPLYVLEALQDPEALIRPDDDFDEPFTDIDRFPATVARALRQRLIALPDDVRTVMQAMAVLAEPCSSQLVSDITGLDRRRTLSGMTEAVSRGFLIELSDGICRYSHDQTRRAVYQSMSEDTILAWHHQIYHAVVVGPQTQAEQLAYHADLARLWDDAAHWHDVAARAAREINAFGVAAEHYRQADAAAEKAKEPAIDRVDALLDYERALDILGRREEQHALLKRLRDLDLPLESQVELAERQALLLGHTDEYEEAAELAVTWADRAFDAGLPSHRLLTALGVVRYLSGSLHDAIDALKRALKTAPDDESGVEIRNYLGRALIDVSDFEEGDRLVAEARIKAEELGDARSQVEALMHQAVSAVNQGNNAAAIDYAEQTVPLSRSIGYRLGEAKSLLNLAILHAIQGRAGRALPLFSEAAEVFDSLDDARGQGYVQHNLGELYYTFLGENDEAALLFNKAVTYFRGSGDQRSEMLALSRLAAIDWHSGRRRLARRRLRGLIERAIAIGDPLAELEAHRLAAECSHSVGDYGQAAEHLDRALQFIEENAIAYVLPHALAHRGLVALEAGDLELGLSFADRAAPANKPESDAGLVTAWRCGTIFRAAGRDDDAAEQFDLAFRLLESNLEGTEPQQAAAARSLPQFKSIIEDYERYFERVVEMSLPSADAPTGRALQPEEYQSVRWTISLPADMDEENPSKRRRNRLIRLCDAATDQLAVARIHDLATALSVSERTIKRDLAELRSAGHRPRTRRST